MIQGASVISPGAQINVKSNMSTCEFTWPLDLINRGSFITITTIIISTTWIFFFVFLFFFFGMIDEEEENWMGTSHLVSPKLVSSAANTLVVKVASKASDVRDSHSISQSWSRWSGDLLTAKVLLKMLLIHSVEAESLASYTTPGRHHRKTTNGEEKKKVFLSSPAVVTGGNSLGHSLLPPAVQTMYIQQSQKRLLLSRHRCGASDDEESYRTVWRSAVEAPWNLPPTTEIPGWRLE